MKEAEFEAAFFRVSILTGRYGVRVGHKGILVGEIV